MDNFSLANSFDDYVTNSVNYDLFTDFNNSNNLRDDQFKQNLNQSNCDQSVNSFLDISDTTINYNKNPVFNLGDLLSESNTSSVNSIPTKQSDYKLNEFFTSNIETSNCYRDKSLEEKQNDNNKEHKKIKKIGKKLNLIKKKKSPFCERKSAHATAESRYRTSINEQIKRLKTLVAGPTANWKKSAVLETVAEYIIQMKRSNNKLVEENLQLKLKLSHYCSTNVSPINSSYIVVPAVTSLTANCVPQQYQALMYSCI